MQVAAPVTAREACPGERKLALRGRRCRCASGEHEMKSRDLALRWPRHENGVKTREPRRREPGPEAGRAYRP